MASALLEKQFRFSRMLPCLLNHAFILGYDITGGDWRRDERCDYGHPNSAHKNKLAVDLSLFQHNKIMGKRDHAKLHDYWDSIGGAPRIKGDLGHYSLAHNGVR